MSDRLDLTVTYTMHNALRRELRHLAQAAARADPDPRRVLRTAAGWELFRRALHAHQAAEDDALWPALRRALKGRPFDLTRLEAIEAEHAALASVLGAIDTALIDPGVGPELFGELADSLIIGLEGHLDHEEQAVFPLVQAVLTQDQWEHFGRAHAQRIEPHAARLLPWLLDGADERTAGSVLAQLLPEPAHEVYTRQWWPAYAALDRWGAARAAARAAAPTPAPVPGAAVRYWPLPLPFPLPFPVPPSTRSPS
ncbi:hemerythrin domain-containing protein [Kitasatospora sp. NPDC093806]|uniref:hemerythrin domain-containing protein n=1 Tax=Kitasatospora sp. NPDC093806 TaxID=3155075 RepID=UPI00341ACD26